jgi:hypothetical protein
MKEKKKMANYEPGSEPSLETISARMLILAPRTIRNKLLLLKLPSL